MKILFKTFLSFSFSNVLLIVSSGRYNSDNMRQTTCQVFNPIMVDGYNALSSCIPVVQASDSITADAKL